MILIILIKNLNYLVRASQFQLKHEIQVISLTIEKVYDIVKKIGTNSTLVESTDNTSPHFEGCYTLPQAFPLNDVEKIHEFDKHLQDDDNYKKYMVSINSN